MSTVHCATHTCPRAGTTRIATLPRGTRIIAVAAANKHSVGLSSGGRWMAHQAQGTHTHTPIHAHSCALHSGCGCGSTHTRAHGLHTNNIPASSQLKPFIASMPPYLSPQARCSRGAATGRGSWGTEPQGALRALPPPVTPPPEWWTP